MSLTSGARPTLDIGHVLRQAFAVVGANLVAFFTLALLLAGLPSAGLGALQLAGGVHRVPTVSDVLFFLAHGATTLACEAALVLAAIGAFQGGRVSVSRALGGAMRKLPGLLAIEVLYLLAFVTGLALLIVPGIMIAMAWRVSAEAYLIEGTSVIGALRRSAELTRGHRWRILALFVLGGAASLVVWGGFVWLAYLAPSLGAAGTWLTVLVSNPLYYLLSAMVFGPLGATLYRDLRQLHDGVGLEGAAAVFD